MKNTAFLFVGAIIGAILFGSQIVGAGSVLQVFQGGTSTSTVGTNKGYVFTASTTLGTPVWSTPTMDMWQYKQVGSTTKANAFKQWYGNMQIQTLALNNGAPAINTLLASPFSSGPGGCIDDLRFTVITGGAAGSVARIGIYQSASTTGELYPTTRLVDSGEFDTTTNTIKSMNPAVCLVPNRLYWMAYHAGVAAPTVRAGNVSSMPSILGTNGDDPNFTPTIGLSTSTAYAALPATFPLGAIRYSSTMPVGLYHLSDIPVGSDF